MVKSTSAGGTNATADTTARDGAPISLGTKRLVVRRSTAVWPFVWRGLVPLLGLLFVGWYAMGPTARSIEANVRSEVRSALDLRGFQWVALFVSGQSVWLSGVAPSGINDATNQALTIAREATCSTDVRRFTCAVAVVGHFTDGAAAPSVFSSATTRNSVTTAAGAAAPVVEGPAVKPPTRGDPNPTNAMTLPATTPSVIVAAPAPGVVAAAPVAEPAPGTTQVLAAPTPAAPARPTPITAAACEAEMKRLTSAVPIDFETGSAVITVASRVVLDQLVGVARTCPGLIRVEGHTDTVGGAADNLQLSLDRAFAVRDALVQRGVVSTQMLAEGFGEDRPVASNKTPAGRAQNRRIDLRALPPPGG